MPAPADPLTGNALLKAVCDSMAALHEHYHHRAPATIKSQLMGGVYTQVEKTLIELERTRIVQDTRSAFQNAMQHRFVAEVERLSGRRVTEFISNSHVGPDLEIELFLLAPAA